MVGLAVPDVITLGETMVLFAPLEAGPLRYARRFEMRLGGAESNFAVGVVRLGFSAGWVSRLGDDEFGRFIYTQLRGEGVDVSRVRFDPEAPTGVFFKELGRPGGTRVYYYRRGSAASRLSPADLDEDYFAGARWLHLTGITPALSESCRAAVEVALNLARRHGLKVSFDPNLRLKLWPLELARRVLVPLMGRADVVLGGHEELCLLLEKTTPEAAAEALLAAGVGIVAVKLGGEGALVMTADFRDRVPAFPVDRVVDPVGAGDAFDAGFVAGLLLGRSLVEATRLGNACGALMVAVTGDYEALPTLAEAEAFMAGRLPPGR
ncbi:MAG: sugar kinase [Chloroflexota bacterium]